MHRVSILLFRNCLTLLVLDLMLFATLPYSKTTFYFRLLTLVVGHRAPSSTELSSNEHYRDHRYSLTLSILILGPKTNSPEMIAKLRKAGMNIVRMNFSHGSHEVRNRSELL